MPAISRARWIGRLIFDVGLAGMLLLAIMAVTSLEASRPEWSRTARTHGLFDHQPLIAETPAPQSPINAQPAPQQQSPSVTALVDLFTQPPLDQGAVPNLDARAAVPQTAAQPAEVDLTQTMPASPGPQTAAVPEPEPSTQPVVEFFSTKVKADSVVFVVDRSGSMSGPRFDRLLDELSRAVRKLQPEQKFYVIFFSDGPYLMLDEVTPSGLSPATDQRKSAFLNWLKNVGPDGGTFPEEALMIAARLRPDIIMLLSDGEFEPLQPVTMHLIGQNKIKVSTLAFEDLAGAVQLERIADQTGGTYRFVSSDPRLDQDAVVGRFRDQDARERLEAVTIARQNRFDVPGELIALLKDPVKAIQQEARRALVQLAEGADYGPAENADALAVAAAVGEWTIWHDRRDLILAYKSEPPATLAVALQSADLNQRWAAAFVIHQRQVDLPQELIAALADADNAVARLAHSALVRLAKGSDFGPAEPATSTDVQNAQGRWQTWLLRRNHLERLAQGTEPAMLVSLESADLHERWAAVHTIGKRVLPLGWAVFPLLNDPEQEIQTETHSTLVVLAEGTDYGNPGETADATQRTDLVGRWGRWARRTQLLPILEKKPEKDIVETMKHADAATRWAGATVANQRQFDLPVEYLALLEDADFDVRVTARQGLVRMAETDFGPAQPEEPAEWPAAVKKWKGWWQEEREKRANSLLQPALKLAEKGVPAARARLEQIQVKYPGTKASARALAELRKFK